MSSKKMVTKYDVLQECENNGSLEKLRSKGVLSFTPIIHKEIYERLLLEINQNDHLKSPVSQSVHNTAIFFSMSDASIWRIKKDMEG